MVAEDVPGHGAHIGNLLRRGEMVHRDLGLCRAELESGRAGGRGEVDDFDKVVGKVARGRVLDASADKVLRVSACRGDKLTVLGADFPVWSLTRANSKMEGILTRQRGPRSTNPTCTTRSPPAAGCPVARGARHGKSPP